MVIAICDDNESERQIYNNKISEIAKEEFLDIDVWLYSNGQQILFEFDAKENMPDILYLDICMPDMSGIEVANQLRTNGFKGEIIFLTQSNQHWQSAFDVHAYHYIVKNDCSDEKFKSILLNVINSIIEKNEDYILFNSCGETLAIKIKDIYYFEVTKRIVSVIWSEGKFEFYSSLSKLEEQLENRNFIRIHKSYLVAKNYIIKVFYNSVILKDNTKLPVGRAYKNTVCELFNKGATN